MGTMKLLVTISSLLLLISIEISANDCTNAMKGFLTDNISKNNIEQIDIFKDVDLTNSEKWLALESLSRQKNKATDERVHNYLQYASTLREKERIQALSDIDQLDQKEINSKHVQRFTKLEKKFSEKFANNVNEISSYRNLYNSCHSYRPNTVNSEAVSSFKKFNMALSLGTFAASYSYYNMDKEKDQEWFLKLGYDLANTIIFSYFGSKAQSNIEDSQITRGIKSYLVARVLGLEDVAFYNSLVSTDNKKAEERINQLKNDPEIGNKVKDLLNTYEKSGVYRKFRDNLILELKHVKHTITLGLNGNSMDTSGVDWNNIRPEDLDRNEVKDVLVMAAMAEIYQASKSEYIATSDKGLDRYAFNSIYYFAQIPRNIVQSYLTFEILCMGQKNPKLAFFKAFLLNTSIGVLNNQLLFSTRDKLINQ